MQESMILVKEECLMENDPLVFEINAVKGKPNSYRKTKCDPCPFCNVAQLTDVFERQGEMIWLKNKYPTLRDTMQTVLIESSDHQGDITTYSKAHNRALMRFALACFNRMNNSSEFKSVLWYKNYGPHSAGSLTHPHMQIVGLKQMNGYKYLHQNNFEGVSLFNNKNVEVNVSTHPVQGYIELNFNLLNALGVDLWSDWIQSGAKYMLTILSNGRCDSYNLFFYPRPHSRICAKLVARFAAPPYFVGYKLSQVDNYEKLVAEAKQFKHFFESDAH